MSLSPKGDHPTSYGNYNVYGNDLGLDTSTTAECAQIQIPVAQSAANQQPVYRKEKKKCWLLRPVAWLVLIAMAYLMNLIIFAIFKIAANRVDQLSTLPTIRVIIITLLFGGISLKLFSAALMWFPTFVMMVSDSIYPSMHGFRYFFVGLISLLFYLLLIVLTAIGIVTADQVFWLYAEYGFLCIAYIVLMCVAHSEKSR